MTSMTVNAAAAKSITRTDFKILNLTLKKQHGAFASCCFDDGEVRLFMSHRISGVDIGSPAEALLIEVGSTLLSINGEEVLDVVDYEHLTMETDITIKWETPEGEIKSGHISKDEYEPLGLSFSDDLIGGIRSCKNRCVFCFIDQMPRGGRKTLHVKDDDWRMSLIMGNYVTLTNVSEREFERIIRRKASPLYISVHTLDPKLRVKMMANPSAALIGERLRRLYNAGIKVHCQIVLCPGLNDGEELVNTLSGLCELYPCVQSVAVVPVGLTKFREGLFPLRGLTAEDAGNALDQIEGFQREMLKLHNERVIYGSDELYLLAGRDFPSFDEYEDFIQLENGVGMFRKLEWEIKDALLDIKPLPRRIMIDALTGTLIAGRLQHLYDMLEPYGVNVRVTAISNSYFGESVTVAGLVCAHDIIEQTKDRLNGELVILPRSMLREKDFVFLDGMSIFELETHLKRRVIPISADDGYNGISELFSALSELISK